MKLRYAVYAVPGKALIRGTGESINLSITGLLMLIDGRATQGDLLVAALDWPLRAIDGQRLFLIITGQVVRVKRSHIAIALRSHRLWRANELGTRYEAFFGPLPDGEVPDLRCG
jgi:hypothetical protein